MSPPCHQRPEGGSLDTGPPVARPRPASWLPSRHARARPAPTSRAAIRATSTKLGCAPTPTPAWSPARSAVAPGSTRWTSTRRAAGRRRLAAPDPPPQHRRRAGRPVGAGPIGPAGPGWPSWVSTARCAPRRSAPSSGVWPSRRRSARRTAGCKNAATLGSCSASTSSSGGQFLMMMALAERFIALAGHHVGSPSVAFMRDNTAQSIRRRSENTYAIDFRDATLVVRHVTIFGRGHGLQRAIIDESQHRTPERLIMAQH